MSEGTKELKELLVSLKDIAVFAKKVAADKKVNLEDLPALVDLAKNMDEVLAGFDGLNKIPDEVKDIDEAEAMELLGQVLKLVKEIKAA